MKKYEAPKSKRRSVIFHPDRIKKIFILKNDKIPKRKRKSRAHRVVCILLFSATKVARCGRILLFLQNVCLFFRGVVEYKKGIEIKRFSTYSPLK